LHITEVLGDDRVDELHLCEDCAKKYLHDPTPAPAGKPAKAATAAADDPGGKACDVCGIPFVEFRNSGRLGCPHDYDAFREELLPLLDSIHGDTRHSGKAPRRKPKPPSAVRHLAQLRKQLQQAIQAEQYEAAAQLRDQIKKLDDGGPEGA
jgi:protein arginine kinase activator